MKPPRARTFATMRPSSSNGIEVPVGFAGDASSAPRVRAPQFASSRPSVIWKRVSANTGTGFGTPSNAATKCRLHG